jgi:N-acetylneuraminate synthase
MEPEEMARLVDDSRIAWQALGAIAYGAIEAEKPSTIFRRSIYAVADIVVGEPFTPQNVRCIRPGLGLAPRYYPMVLGRFARFAIARGTPISWDLI